MVPRSQLLLLSAALLASGATPPDGGEADGVCEKDGGGKCGSPLPPGEGLLLEDGVAQDVRKLCPVFNTSAVPLVQRLFRQFKAITGPLSMMSLWPSGISPADFADDYFVVNYVIVARVFLGLYKRRSIGYVGLPRGIIMPDDIMHVANIHAPRTDPDGSPNFYWFESALPKFVMDLMYVPMITCFYSSLRRLSTDTNLLNGTFDDALDHGTVNSWERVLKNSPHKTMREWVMSFYNIASSWDGTPLWPAQMTDFSVYFKKDEWDDRLEYAIAFHLIGCHRVESGSWTFENVAGYEKATLHFRLPLKGFSVFAVREHFGRYGADMYFNEDGLPVLIETPAGEIIVRGDPKWQYWKFVWRSTLVTGITLVDHLHFTHFRAANIFARALRTAVPADHPFRRLATIFSFGSIFVNVQAMHQLIGPNHMLHRASAFQDFNAVSNLVPDSDSGLVTDITDFPGIKPLYDDGEWEKLHPKLKESPYYADGRLFMAALLKMKRGLFAKLGEGYWCMKDGSFSPTFQKLRMEILGVTAEAHYMLDSPVYENKSTSCGMLLPLIAKRFAPTFFAVTGFHRHVGFVGDYYADPSLATMSWKDGEAAGRPKQHMIMTIINVFTSTRQPLLKEDYTYLFKGLEPQVEKDLTEVWHNFLEELRDIEHEIDRRNTFREIPNINMSPRFVESSVSK